VTFHLFAFLDGYSIIYVTGKVQQDSAQPP
jgi:hypothetical protein